MEPFLLTIDSSFIVIMTDIAIIGAGLVGCLAALAFAKKGYNVQLYEGRADLRLPEEQTKTSLRSINLAVSARGILALKSVDPEMAERVLKDLIPMSGRMVHDLDGKQTSQKYGLYGESINSINRALLNRALLDELDAAGVAAHFNHKLQRADLRDGRPSLLFKQLAEEGKEVRREVDVVVGADGSFSTMRNQIQRVVKMNFSQEYIDHYYLELKIDAGPNNTFALDPNHLHIWPRHEFMLIALANGDKTFTSTLFAPQSIFDQLDSWQQFMDFFTKQFPDAFTLIGEKSLKESFQNNPRGTLVSVKCSPYHAGGKAIIIGDAAHSMVPFYGQGMNCGFEDVRKLMECLETTDFDFEKGFNLYSATRHKDLLSIVDLSMNNYIEMRHSVTSSLYLLRKAVDGVLSRTLGDAWLPLYTMVSFRPDIPYSRAVEKEALQKTIINYGLTTVGLLSLGGILLFKK